MVGVIQDLRLMDISIIIYNGCSTALYSSVSYSSNFYLVLTLSIDKDRPDFF